MEIHLDRFRQFRILKVPKAKHPECSVSGALELLSTQLVYVADEDKTGANVKIDYVLSRDIERVGVS